MLRAGDQSRFARSLHTYLFYACRALVTPRKGVNVFYDNNKPIKSNILYIITTMEEHNDWGI